MYAPGMFRQAETVTNMCRHSNFGRLDAPEQEQRRGQDFTITTIITSTDDDDEDDFGLSEDDFVLFKNDIPTIHFVWMEMEMEITTIECRDTRDV